ncbi:unnamed protein product [Commensalibacter communis]|nr:hypothetical protein [Commensalibacter communis]CAI3950009.1 unnamed protein product [Commensalibacter communis]CAI3958930.1 unnamed protein product [Commensalibacter communis]
MLGKKYRYLFMALDEITNPAALAIIHEDLNCVGIILRARLG